MLFLVLNSEVRDFLLPELQSILAYLPFQTSRSLLLSEKRVNKSIKNKVLPLPGPSNGNGRRLSETNKAAARNTLAGHATRNGTIQNVFTQHSSLCFVLGKHFGLYLFCFEKDFPCTFRNCETVTVPANYQAVRRTNGAHFITNI